MTVHSEERPETAASRGIEHMNSEIARPRRADAKAKVLFVLLAVMTGVVGGLVAYIAATRASGQAEPIVWAAATFAGTTTLALLLGEKTGLIE